MEMDYRTDSFARRFKSAQPHMKTQDIQGLVSLKYRDNCVHDSEYSHFIEDYLKQKLGLCVEQLHGDFGGQAWLATDQHQNMAILVQHETGLEILGAIGSVASLIALLPLISLGWTKLRHRIFHPRLDSHEGSSVEIRRFDQNNKLIEQSIPSVEFYVLNVTLQDHAILKQKVEQLEAEISELKKRQTPAMKKSAINVRPKRKKRS